MSVYTYVCRSALPKNHNIINGITTSRGHYFLSVTRSKQGIDEPQLNAFFFGISSDYHNSIDAKYFKLACYMDPKVTGIKSVVDIALCFWIIMKLRNLFFLFVGWGFSE